MLSIAFLVSVVAFWIADAAGVRSSPVRIAQGILLTGAIGILGGAAVVAFSA